MSWRHRSRQGTPCLQVSSSAHAPGSAGPTRHAAAHDMQSLVTLSSATIVQVAPFNTLIAKDPNCRPATRWSKMHTMVPTSPTAC
jgi:hypothetical protein